MKQVLDVNETNLMYLSFNIRKRQICIENFRKLIAEYYIPKAESDLGINSVVLTDEQMFLIDSKAADMFLADVADNKLDELNRFV